VSWNLHHSASEKFVVEAEHALRTGQRALAEDLYQEASLAETKAFDAVDVNKLKTRGVTAVSAVALSFKARRYAVAEQLAHRYLGEANLPRFAVLQIRDLLQAVWNSLAAEEAGLKFPSESVLFSLKGGDVVYGGAPLDLIMQRIEGVNSVLLRTAEMLLERPIRRRGRPDPEIQAMFKPWLFQALGGSYQFAVRVEEPQQLALWASSVKFTAQDLTDKFLDILRATADEPEAELSKVVPTAEYREAFVRLSRNLAPSSTGKVFGRLEVREASAPNDLIASFAGDTRSRLSAILRKWSDQASNTGTLVTISGILRNLSLDQDWLDIALPNSANRTRVFGIGDLLDDVIGPMVNHTVTVSAVQHGDRYTYRDIELVE
jgi:hypothetical protein